MWWVDFPQVVCPTTVRRKSSFGSDWFSDTASAHSRQTEMKIWCWCQTALCSIMHLLKPQVLQTAGKTKVCVLERKDSQISLMQPCCPFPGPQPLLTQVGWEGAGLSDHARLQFWEVPNSPSLPQKIPVGSNDLLISMNPSSTGGPLLSSVWDPFP